MRDLRLLLLALVLVGCQKGADTPEVAPPTTAAADATGAPAADTAAAPVDAAAETSGAPRDKLLALAVASECLRKGGAPPEQSANTMLALYKAHGIDLDTYTREMSRLAGDPAFQAEIEAKTRECPTAPVTADTLQPAEVAAPPDAQAETHADTQPAPEVVVADTTPAPEVVVIADTTPVPEVVVIADTTPAPEVVVADTKVAALDTTPVTDTQAPLDTTPEVSYTGNWTGQLYGGPPGQLRVTISGRVITSAVATFGRITLRLKGTMSEKGALTLGGTAGDNFVRISGKAHSSGRAINGTWDGVVDRKRANGRVQLKR